MMTTGPLTEADRAAWEVLARGYKKFYGTPTTDEQYESTWRQLMAGTGFRALGARLNDGNGNDDGQLVGITHYFFHPFIWYGNACYLQDLFTAEAARGQGVARALIEAVANQARENNAVRLYWNTKEDNARARVLYDKLASFGGFIRYDYPL
ncbi:MAG TPA: GNAT family N-acetyltransferase [Streptosporangiaceae bacterium]|jgi:GNAT superfamily N-acetyltransferase